MRYLILSVLTAAVLSGCSLFKSTPEAEKLEPITPVAGWNLGDSLRFNLKRTFEMEDPKMVYQAQGHLKVEKATDTGFVVRWRFDTAYLENSYFTSNKAYAIARATAELTDGLTVRFATDKQGHFRRFLNPDDIIGQINRRIDSIADSLRNEKMTVILASNYKSMSQIQAALLNEIRLSTMPYGTTYNQEDSVKHDLKGRYIMSNAEVPGTAYLRQTGAREVKGRSNVDAKKSANLIFESNMQQRRDLGMELPEGTMQKERRRFKQMVEQGTFHFSQPAELTYTCNEASRIVKFTRSAVTELPFQPINGGFRTAAELTIQQPQQ